MKLGIIGLQGSGKTTVFEVLTGFETEVVPVDAGFCRIPAVGRTLRNERNPG